MTLKPEKVDPRSMAITMIIAACCATLPFKQALTILGMGAIGAGLAHGCNVVLIKNKAGINHDR